jgi:hypothetical protein
MNTVCRLSLHLLPIPVSCAAVTTVHLHTWTHLQASAMRETTWPQETMTNWCTATLGSSTQAVEHKEQKVIMVCCSAGLAEL